jgi:FixJ family two-component response regulator
MPRNAQVEHTPLISVVDDDEPIREAINELISSLGYRSVKFASAEEFLSSDRLSDTSCVITDVRMPGLSGIDLQSHLIAQGHTMPKGRACARCPPVQSAFWGSRSMKGA